MKKLLFLLAAAIPLALSAQVFPASVAGRWELQKMQTDSDVIDFSSYQSFVKTNPAFTAEGGFEYKIDSLPADIEDYMKKWYSGIKNIYAVFSNKQIYLYTPAVEDTGTVVDSAVYSYNPATGVLSFIFDDGSNPFGENVKTYIKGADEFIAEGYDDEGTYHKMWMRKKE